MPNILIVDDDDIDREFTERCLNPLQQIEILTARDGVEALQIVSQTMPDLVLTDLRMPKMDGLTLVERLQEDFPLLPVVLMTSRGNEQTAVRALRAGAASYVPKQDLKQHLAETTRQVLEVARSARKKTEVLKYLVGVETEFHLSNDPTLIGPVVAFLQDNMKRIGFGNESTRTRVGIALTEALCNAMIHGNLELDSDLRRFDPETYDKLIRERQEETPYSSRRVYCKARESADRLEYSISDEGLGFDHQSMAEPADLDLLDIAGRGIMLIRTFMDSVEYSERGNRLVMVKRVPPRRQGVVI